MRKYNKKYFCRFLRLISVIVTLALKRQVFTARCTFVQSAVLLSHVACLSVRLSICNVGGL